MSRQARRNLAVAALAGLCWTVTLAAAPPVEVTTLVAELDGAVGGVEVFVDSLYGTSGDTVDPEGNLLQSNFTGDFLVRVHRDGTVERLASDLEGPVGVAVGSDGTVYVTNCRGNWIARVSADGTVREHSRLPGVGGGHVAFTGQDLYATTFRGNQIHRVGLDGSVETVAGSGAFGRDDGAGPEASFSSPNGISYDRARGLLYVNDHLIPFSERTTSRPVSSLRRLALPSLTRTLTRALEEGGVEALETAYRDFKQGRPSFTQLEANRLGYTLLQQGEAAAALRVFELNAESYPDSFNVWDSLAEAHKAAGNRD